jgi:PTS system cellobiose-specific IIB component
MKYITLVCAAGMSTSMLMSKMKDSAKKQGLDVNVIAMSESSFASYKEPTDVLLLGPQVSYLLDKMKSEYEPKGIKVEVINMMDYGMMNGEKVLKDALSLLD